MLKSIAELSPLHQSLFQQLTAVYEEPSLIRLEAISAADAFEEKTWDVGRIMAVTHDAQKILKIFAANLHNNVKFLEAYHDLDVEFLREQNPKSSTDMRRAFAKVVSNKHLRFGISIEDMAFDALIRDYATSEGVSQLERYEEREMRPVRALLRLSSQMNDVTIVKPSTQRRSSALDRQDDPLYMKALEGVRGDIQAQVSFSVAVLRVDKPILGLRSLHRMAEERGIDISYGLMRSLAGLSEGKHDMFPDIDIQTMKEVRELVRDMALEADRDLYPPVLSRGAKALVPA